VFFWLLLVSFVYCYSKGTVCCTLNYILGTFSFIIIDAQYPVYSFPDHKQFGPEPNPSRFFKYGCKSGDYFFYPRFSVADELLNSGRLM
jgi:hypothetical protein